MRRTTIGIVTAAFGWMTAGLIASAVGVALTVATSYARAEVAPPDDGISTVATVVGAVETHVLIDGIARPSFAPVYEYDDVDGRLHRVTDHISAGSRPPAVGSTVEISYRPGDPESVRRTDIDRDWLQWMSIGGAGIAGAGGAVALAALVVTIATGRRDQNRRPHRRTPFVT